MKAAFELAEGHVYELRDSVVPHGVAGGGEEVPGAVCHVGVSVGLPSCLAGNGVGFPAVAPRAPLVSIGG